MFTDPGCVVMKLDVIWSGKMLTVVVLLEDVLVLVFLGHFTQVIDLLLCHQANTVQTHSMQRLWERIRTRRPRLLLS